MPSDADVAEFGRLFQEFLQTALERVAAQPSELVALLTGHLGVDPTGLPVVAQSYQTFDHANVVVTATAGMTASFFTELARRATLLAALDDEAAPEFGHVRAALAELEESRRAMSHWPSPVGRRLAQPEDHDPS